MDNRPSCRAKLPAMTALMLRPCTESRGRSRPMSLELLTEQRQRPFRSPVQIIAAYCDTSITGLINSIPTSNHAFQHPLCIESSPINLISIHALQVLLPYTAYSTTLWQARDHIQHNLVSLIQMSCRFRVCHRLLQMTILQYHNVMDSRGSLINLRSLYISLRLMTKSTR